MIQNKTQTEKDGLTARQLRLITFILSTASIEAASKEAKIGRATVYRWLKEKHFREKLEQKRQELFEEGLSRLKAATDKASQRLIELLDSNNVNIRRLAAKDILSFALKAIETQNLEDRIDRIEEILEKRYIS